MSTEKLLFIDTNIWLDFYRSRNEAGLELLQKVEQLRDQLIVTYQLESEFKRNRQNVLLESYNNLKDPEYHLPLANIVAKADAAKTLAKHIKETKHHIAEVRKLIAAAITAPEEDNVYKACEELFHRQSDLVLTRENKERKWVRTKALRRFLQGYPPRKRNDTSIGDGFNREWMIYCAERRQADLVIVSRDGDYGVTIEKKCHLNDHLQQEFKERLQGQCNIVYFDRLTEGLKYFDVKVSNRAVKAERSWIRNEFPVGLSRGQASARFKQLLQAALEEKTTTWERAMEKQAAAERRGELPDEDDLED